jgi:uncharacterized protein YdeI (YjbR/CyaY-like superfamily)
MSESAGIDNLERVEVTSLAELRCWFEHNHSRQESIWLVVYKKVAGEKYVATTHVVDTCICFGWMDGRKMKLDEHRTMQLLSPRKTKHWAASYKERYFRLLEEGLMHESGLKTVREAQESGRWEAMTQVDNLVLPDDLKQALELRPLAMANYEAFPDSTKRDILRWIHLAKRPETRRKRIVETAEKALCNVRASGTGVKPRV